MSTYRRKEKELTVSEENAKWESSVAGVGETSEDPLDATLREAAAHLKQLVRSENWEAVEVFVTDGFNGTDSDGEALFPRERLLKFARYYGGNRQLGDDLAKNPNKIFQKHGLQQIRRRLGLETLQAELKRDEFLERGRIAQEINSRVIKPAAEIVTGTAVLKLLAELKQWNQETANALADEGHVGLATVLATVDFFIPESGFDLALTLVPTTGGALIVSRVSQSFARRFPKMAAHFEKMSAALTKDLIPELRKLFGRSSKGDAEALRVLTSIDEYATGYPVIPSKEVPVVAEDSLKTVRVLTDKKAAEVLPPTPPEFLSGARGPTPLTRGDQATFETVLRKMSQKFQDACRRELRSQPRSNAPAVEWIEKANGEVVQVITGPIARRSGGRQEILGEGLGAVGGLEPREGVARAHLIPDILRGDSQRYNLVYTPHRLNTSLMGEVDKLMKEDIKDATLRIEITFENWERAWKRWPKPGQDAFKYTLRRPQQRPSTFEFPWAFTNADIQKLGHIKQALRKALANAQKYGAQPSSHGGRNALVKMMNRLDDTGRVKTAFE